MHVIDAEFRRLSEIAVPDLLGAIGVYVLWSGRAIARPTYIGEGSVLRRLVIHHNRFARPFDGFAAILSHEGIPWQRAKAEARILEAMLLSVARRVDRRPSTNRAPGMLRDLLDIFEQHGTVRINVFGLDPLRPPEENPRITRRKQIVLRDFGGPVQVTHDWRIRRKRH
jgi:hypothetical protein